MYPINIGMKQTFSQYLLEFRIAVPTSAVQQAMNIVACGYFSYISRLMRESGEQPSKEFTQALKAARQKYGTFKVYDSDTIQGTVSYNPSELPDNYRKKTVRLQKSYPIKIVVDAHATNTKNGAEYYQMSRGSSASIFVNLNAVPGITDNPGDAQSIAHDLKELENMISHEMQHATQDVVLRKFHPSQMAMPKADDDEDTYLNSQIEFQPQITTAVGDFKRTLAAVRKRQEVSPEQATALMRAFLNPVAPMPEGFLKYKPNFHSRFFKSLYRNNPLKWKKAVKDFHRLATSN
ncbi:hypothetical protein Xoosp13_117 [Xanthomonas phage Xoo-sp13]|nr:hypothetical protein Xoosp13_117 [Xanthomonas phage Xoo-sp13]